eukprot:gene34690-46570_t
MSERLFQTAAQTQDNNPYSVIQKRLLQKKTEREQEAAEIEALELEKAALQKILPKVLYQIDSIRERIENKQKEMHLYDSAIAEIEQNFGNILFSANVFEDNS